MLRLFIIFCLNLLIVSNAFSKNIVLTITDSLPSNVTSNIKSYLGDLPTNELERISFLHSAENNTIKALQALGYYKANVDLRIDKDENNSVWNVALDVVLNDPTRVNSIDININNEANNDEKFSVITSTLPIKNNDPLNHAAYEKIKSDILALGLQRGYFNGKFDVAQIAITPDNVADIKLTYNSGKRYTFGEIDFINNTINQNVIDKLIPFNVGDKYELSKLQALQNNLEKTQYFNNIVIVPQQNSNPAIESTEVPIQISLARAKRHYFDVGLGYVTDTKFRISAGWKTPLVNKFGHRQETRIKYSKDNPTGEFTYSIPIDNALNDIIQVRLVLEDDRYGDITSKYRSAQISKKTTLDDLSAEAYFRVLHETWDIDTFNDAADYLLLGYSWSFTQRSGSLIDPSGGFSQFYNIEGTHTAISSSTNFIKFNGRWRYIKMLAPRHRLVTRAELGYTYIDDAQVTELSPSLRFFAGGDQSIRGFNYQSVGPTIKSSTDDELIVTGGTRLAVASIEYQYYFTDNIRGAIFFDAGSSFNKNIIEKSYAVGPGIHYISPIGAIKLDLGYSISENSPSWRIHLNLGAEL
jgi:translocation and assembly module TamA